MSRDGGILFWGGEYLREVTINQARRHAQLKNKVLPFGHIVNTPDGQLPLFEFKLSAGAALKAR